MVHMKFNIIIKYLNKYKLYVKIHHHIFNKRIKRKHKQRGIKENK
jgi:hypothetical protein